MLKISKIIQGNFLLVTLAIAPDSYGAAGSYGGGLLEDFDKETLIQVSKLVQAAYPDERDSVKEELSDAGWLIAPHDSVEMIHAVNGPLNVFSFEGTKFWKNSWQNSGSLVPMAGDDGCAGPDVGRFILSGRIRCPGGLCDDKYATRLLRTRGVLDMIPSADDDSKFIFAGHSMGGAVSQIAALHGCAIQTPEQSRTKNTYNLTFGAPGVFSSDVVEKFNAIFPGSAAMRVEIKGDWIPRFGSKSKAGMLFELDGDPFPAGALAERGPFSDLAAGHPAHTYVRNFPSIL